jgi:hypothetical protein
MAEITKIWKINSENTLMEMKRKPLDLEQRIESWIENDISIISDDILIIGRQVKTAYGGIIDLLGINQDGDLVVIELKRDKTPRDITAQVLDYASWVQDLSGEDIIAIANEYFIKYQANFQEAFKRKYENPLPEEINGSHKLYIVGSEIDSHSERIVKYLNNTLGADINALTFSYYENKDGEYIARNFLIEPDDVICNRNKITNSKRLPPLSIKEFIEYAKEQSFHDLLEYTIITANSHFDSKATSRTTIFFNGNMDGHKNAIFTIEPMKSNQNDGISFYLHASRFREYFSSGDAKLNELKDELSRRGNKGYMGNTFYRGFIRTKDDVDYFCKILES